MPKEKPGRDFSVGDFVKVQFYHGENENIQELSKTPGIIVKTQFCPGGIQGFLHVSVTYMNEFMVRQAESQGLHIKPDDDHVEFIAIVPISWVSDREYPEQSEMFFDEEVLQ